VKRPLTQSADAATINDAAADATGIPQALSWQEAMALFGGATAASVWMGEPGFADRGAIGLDPGAAPSGGGETAPVGLFASATPPTTLDWLNPAADSFGSFISDDGAGGGGGDSALAEAPAGSGRDLIPVANLDTAPSIGSGAPALAGLFVSAGVLPTPSPTHNAAFSFAVSASAGATDAHAVAPVEAPADYGAHFGPSTAAPTVSCAEAPEASLIAAAFTAAPIVAASPANPAGPSSGAFITDAGAGSSGDAITDSAVGASGANAAQVQAALDDSGLSVNGTGIKVGVLSDSFNDLGGAPTDEADGALPPAADVQVLKDDPSGGTDEGRAMMQIIHDIAPGASLAFYTAFDSEQDFANGILALAAAGCKVIVDDVAYYDEPFFQNGVVAQAIQTVEAEGVTYVTAAGNDASNGYQAAWTPISGSYDGKALTDAESFGGSLVQTVTISTEGAGNDVPLLLEWNQAYGQASSDLEILVFNGNGQLVGTATNASNGESTNPWVEYDFTKSGTYYVAVENLSGPNPGLIKEITAGDGLPATISGANTGTVVGHAMTPGAISTGAVSVADTPAFGVSPASSESFSSSGAGTELLFANNGTALSSPEVLDPVAVSGVDDIHTTVSDLSDFYGTSAASASLAGVAALILSADPSLTPAAVEQLIEETALPMANAAISGAGLAQVDPAVAAIATPPVVIATDGATSLTELANEYFLDGSGGTGPALKLSGAPVTAGEFAGWTPIGAVATASGYDVAWKLTGTTTYGIWYTDSNGNYLSSTTMLGNSVALETLETTFNQDLNGDGVIGPPKTVIATDGPTSLTEIGNEFYLYNNSGVGPTLQEGGAPVTAAEFAGWTPIGAVATASGYDVAWKLTGITTYGIWYTDSNGNYLSSTTMLGTSLALETIETTFNQDLNGDGVIGPPKTVIATDGGTSLTEIGNEFYLYDSSGVGPTLQEGGAPVTAGEFAGWTPIGAVATASGYDVAWKLTGTDEFGIWYTGSNGNYLSSTTMLSTSLALETIETTFNQDLNGDGVIGPPKTVIATDGGTSLTEIGNEFYLYNGSGVGPTLQEGGAPVTAGEFAGWTPIGAVATASGYEVAWKLAGTTTYGIWITDTGGNYISSTTMSATSPALESAELTFNQDLNGDGVIGPPATSAVAQVSSIANTQPGHDSFTFKPGLGADGIADAAEPTETDRHAPGSALHALLSEMHTGESHWSFQALDNGHDNGVLAHAHLADPHTGSLFFHGATLG
jgi:hypothetical protein